MWCLSDATFVVVGSVTTSWSPLRYSVCDTDTDSCTVNTQTNISKTEIYKTKLWIKK